MTGTLALALPSSAGSTEAGGRTTGSRIASLARLLAGVLFSLTPVTAVIVLGWLMRLMQAEEAAERRRLAGPGGIAIAQLPRWIAGDAKARSRRDRWIGSLLENTRLGLAALATIAASTLPFALLWLFSWWGGWENSFNKGYEQAWVGPSIGLAGVAVSLPLLARMPMALAHQAVEGRMGAFFSRREVSSLIRRAGWRHVALSLMFVAAALPLFAAKAAPAFVEHWSPGFADRNALSIQDFAGSYRVLATGYLVLVLVFLRRASAKLHARAVSVPEPDAASRSTLARLGSLLRTLIVWLIWLGFVVQVYVGQFVSHQWLSWLHHPLLGLPWLVPPGAPF